MICGAGCGIRPRLPQFLLRPDGAAFGNPAQSIWTIKHYMMDRVNQMSETQGVCEIDREATFQVGRNCSTVVFDKRFFGDGFVFICGCSNHMYCNKDF